MKKYIPILILLIISSCKKEDENIQSSQPDFTPEFTTTSVVDIVPNALMSNGYPMGNTYLMQIESYMMLPSVYMNFSNIQYYNRNISQSRSTLQNSWTWTYGGYEITYSYSESNGQFTYDYTVSMNGNNWYYISGWQNTDGSAGQWEYYFDYTNIPGGASLSNWAINFEWQNNNGNYNFEMDYDFGNPNSNTSITMNVNTNNGSGNYSYFTPSNNLMYEYTWSNNGNNGTFASYVTNPPQIYTWP